MRKIISKELKQKVVQLHKEGKLRIEIEQEVGICNTSVVRILREFNLIPPKKDKIIIAEDFQDKEDFRQLIIGSLLGDGSICSCGGRTRNYYLSIAHAFKQKEYLLFKKSILDKYNLTCSCLERTYENKRFKNPKYTEVRLKSRLHPYFTNLRSNHYDSTGHKRVHLDFVKEISALGLAIWYMDDGYVTKNSCIISSCSFTIEEQKVLADILLEKFGLHFTVGKNDNSMYLLAQDFPRFIEIISL